LRQGVSYESEDERMVIEKKKKKEKKNMRGSMDRIPSVSLMAT
jgi:hypothetical protein